MKATRVFMLVLAALLTAALPSAAMTNTEWVKRVYADTLQRSPTSQELASAVGSLQASPQDTCRLESPWPWP